MVTSTLLPLTTGSGELRLVVDWVRKTSTTTSSSLSTETTPAALTFASVMVQRRVKVLLERGVAIAQQQRHALADGGHSVTGGGVAVLKLVDAPGGRARCGRDHHSQHHEKQLHSTTRRAAGTRGEGQ